jgi:hypothetical protein
MGKGFGPGRKLVLNATVALVAAVAVLTLAPGAALARGDGWVHLAMDPFLTTGCGTTLHVSFPVNKEYVRTTEEPDGSTILQSTGSLLIAFATDDGTSITVNASGPGKDVAYPNGDFEVDAQGWNVQGPLTAEQQADLGTPELFASTGKLDFVYHADGTATPITIPHHVIDLCAELLG